eukprot:6483606-Amphidinium_carterae.2
MAVPAIGDEQAVHSVHSSTGQSSSTETSGQVSARSSDDYWDNIVDIMFTTFNDEELITKAHELHEGEAEKEYENYNTEEARLEMTIQHNYEAANGKIEDTEEFKRALRNRDDASLRPIIYEYARDIRERKARWREMKIMEDNKRKEEYKKEFLREQEEEEKQRRKRQRE